MSQNERKQPNQMVRANGSADRSKKPYSIAQFIADLDLLAQCSVEIPHVVIGAARLPASIAGEHSQALMVEITLDRPRGCITGVATSIPMPGYTAFLRGLLIGHRLEAVESVTWRLCRHLRGPLLRSTVAALKSAARTHDIDTAA